MKDFEHLSFSDQDLDQFIARWLSKGLSQEEQQKWNEVLLHNRKFREHFCEWIKSMRDPAWSRGRFQVKGRQS